ncbi:DUF2187 family protein [Aerococcus sanguinicola]|uniref:DUF2187 domain-containing protein n=1 Tax=Aerococcus sanguinicola TaxID=119206 RepID=A0A0X8FCR6_9LACT|nr:MULTISPECIES: DUF2187 family protein [Aerococcus]AMB94872.1 hypothetical protein AWM72_08925 [Aerococcus sanguinicola]MDK7049648.1 DUF2187 family protein [Aerococcus sanguinicola]OFT95857.1 hypothetical protein HMPREF3090_03260 [Aerococcus sp. HMSC23C02]PKZ23122.1 DUF2187 domain-containing protein [Aerococcus sanguinicola]
MKIKLTPEVQALVETELRRGTNKSRIANLIDLSYEEACAVIDQVKKSVRPDVGDEIKFQFRDCDMTGIIEKLLTNSAVVRIYWDYSNEKMLDICEERTIVNFKDIDEFVNIYQ